jgi:hypothetical protein
MSVSRREVSDRNAPVQSFRLSDGSFSPTVNNAL